MKPKQPSCREPIDQKTDGRASPKQTTMAQALRSKVLYPLVEHLLYDSYKAEELEDAILRSGYKYRVRCPDPDLKDLISEYVFYANNCYVSWAMSRFMETNQQLTLCRSPQTIPRRHSIAIGENGLMRIIYRNEDGKDRVVRLGLYEFDHAARILLDIRGIKQAGKGGKGLMQKIELIERLYQEKPFVCTIRPALGFEKVGVYETGDENHISILIPGLDIFRDVAQRLYDLDVQSAKEARAAEEARKLDEKRIASGFGEIGRKLFVPLAEFLKSFAIPSEEIEKAFWKHLPVSLLSKKSSKSEPLFRGAVAETFIRLAVSGFAYEQPEVFWLCDVKERRFDDGMVMRGYGDAAYTIRNPKSTWKDEITEIDILGEFYGDSGVSPVIFEVKNNFETGSSHKGNLPMRKKYVAEIYDQTPVICLIAFSEKPHIGKGEVFDWIIKLPRRPEIDELTRKLFQDYLKKP